MAKKRRYDEEIQKNSGSIGYSKQALESLTRGTYGKETGRQAQYHTSQEQTQQVKKIPALEGMTRSPEWESSFGRKNYVNTDRARAKYEQRIGHNVSVQETPKSSNDENYVVKRDRYDKLMKDSRLANDIRMLAEVNYKNANQDATVSQEWADEYGAKKITGGYTKSQFIDTLSRRYGLTPKELNDMALTFHSDAYKKENEDYGKQLEQFGEALPVLGSGASLVGTLGSGVEGVYNNIVGGIGGDDRYLSNIFSTTKKAPREGAKKNIESDVGKGLYDIGMGVADMIASQAAGSAPVFLAGNTAGEAQQSAIERGSSTRRASAYGTAAGMLDFVTNKIGLDKAKELAVDSIKSTGIKKFLKQNAIAGLGEAGENIIQDLGQTLLDTLINSNNTELNQLYNDKVASGMSESEAFGDTVKDYITQLATSGALGFAMGSTMQAGKTVLPKVPELVANKWAESQLNAIDPRFQKILEGVMGHPENLQGDVEKSDKIDNYGDLGYNEPINEGGVLNGRTETINGRGNQGNISAGELVQSRPEIGGSMDTGRTYTTPDGRTFGFRNVVSDELSQRMDDAGINNFGLKDTSGQTEEFSRQLAEAKANNVNGRMVDAKEPDELKDAKLFSDDARTCGVAVEPNGNIVAVHKNPSNTQRGAVDDMILTARANGGDRLDCYGRGLVRKYEKDGFIPVARVEWNEKFKPDDWGDNPPEELYVMMKDSRSNEQVVDDIKNATFKTSSPEELDALPLFTKEQYGDDAYFKALEHRDSLMKQPSNEVAFSNPNDNFPAVNGVISRGDINSPIINPEDIPRGGLVTEPVASDETGQSKVITNTAINSDVISRFDYENDPIIQDMATYAKHNNETTYNNALDNVKKNGATLLDEYNSDRRIIDNDQDVDQAMILLRNLKEQIKNASPEEAESLTVQKNMLLSRLREAGTKWGQSIQAFAKWNETPEGALINGEKIVADRAEKWRGRNKEQVKANEELAGKLEEITNGRGYSEKKAKNPAEATSSRLDKALRQQGYDGTMEAEPKAPKTHEQHRVEVENSIRKELGSVADQFTDNDFEYLTYLVENKVPTETIIDEIEHKLNHGEWYTIDESTPVKKATSSKLAKILRDMGDDGRKAKNQNPDTGYPAKSHATIAEEVSNTLQDDPAAVDLDNPEDVEFITTMIEDGVPSWQIEDEISHRLMFGEWYELDTTKEEPKPISSKLKSALDSLVEEPVEEKPELTRDEVREQVRNTLDNEMASAGTSRLYTDMGDFTDEDVDYLTNLIMNGATKQELAQALDTKLATGTFAISYETQAKVNALFNEADKYDPNSKEACEAKALAYRLIAEEVVGDASPFEKFEAWRYLAMLGNPKTMLRNLVGNGMFNAVTGVSNNLSAVLESVVDNTSRALGGQGIQRTKAVLNPSKDGGLIKAAWNDAESHRYKQLTGSKYEKGNMRDAIKGEKSVFSSKAMQGIENAVDKGISDYPAVRAKYSTSLAGYMKANGLDKSAFDAETRYNKLKAESQTRVLTDAEKAEMENLKQTADTLEKGRDYAQQAAEYATFHEDNAVAKAFSKGSRYLLSSDRKSLRALGYGLEGIIPFKKTPANILRSGFEYSPLGAIDSIKKTGKLIYENTGNRKKNLGDTYTKQSWWRGDEQEVNRTLASDVIDSWSKTLTGSGLALLGYYLKSKGILNSSEEDEKYQDDLEGIQNYSITINGKTYTVDWAAPAVMPLLLGAEVKKIFDRHAIPDEKWYGSVDEIVDSINSLLNPIFETSMLQGIQNVMESAANEIKYNDNGAVGGILGSMAMNATTGYATQALPTILGQVARTVDPTRRTTDTATDSNFLAGVEKQGRKLMNKIPGLSFLNPQYRDAYGRTQGNSPFENLLGNLAYQTLSPAYIRDVNTTDADTLARDVYNATAPDENGVEKPIRDKDVFAPWKSKVTYGGEKLSPEQMETYRKASGEASYAIRDALAQEDWFKELDGSKQTEILKSLKSLVNKVGLEANGYPQTGKDYEVYQQGGVPALLDRFKGSAQNTKIKEETGLAPTSNAAKAIKADMESGNTQAAEEKIDEATQLKDAGFTKPGPTDTFYKAKSVVPDLTVEAFAKQYKDIDTDGNQGIKQDELIDYFNRNHYTSEAEAMKTWNMFAPKGKKVPYLKKDGTWGKH